MNQDTSEKPLFYLMATHTYKSNMYQAISNTCFASSIAWFGLYLSLAIVANDVTPALLAGFGILLLTPLSIYYYTEGQLYAVKASEISYASGGS